jgi:hypothetical protein
MGTALLTINQPASKPAPAYQRTCSLTPSKASRFVSGGLAAREHDGVFGEYGDLGLVIRPDR